MAEEKKSHKKVTPEELAIREQAAIQANMDDNSLFIAHSLAGLASQPVDLLNTEEVERRTMEYIADCQRTGTRVSPPGLALWLGITSNDLTNWLTDYGTEEHRKSAARIYQFLHAAFADNALAGKLSPQMAMFFAKNWYGYSDAQRVETAQTVEKRKSLDELAKEAEALPEFNIIDTQTPGKKGKK